MIGGAGIEVPCRATSLDPHDCFIMKVPFGGSAPTSSEDDQKGIIYIWVSAKTNLCPSMLKSTLVLTPSVSSWRPHRERMALYR